MDFQSGFDGHAARGRASLPSASWGVSFGSRFTAREFVVKLRLMCRNIRPLFNFAPPATEEEVRAASLQYVRKVSGVQKPSQANQAEFERAVEEVAKVTRHLVETLVTNAPPRDREEEAQKAKARNVRRFGPSGRSQPRG